MDKDESFGILLVFRYVATCNKFVGVSQNYGYLFGGPHNKDYSLLGSILRSPILGNYLVSLPGAGFYDVFDVCFYAMVS